MGLTNERSEQGHYVNQAVCIHRLVFIINIFIYIYISLLYS